MPVCSNIHLSVSYTSTVFLGHQRLVSRACTYNMQGLLYLWQPFFLYFTQRLGRLGGGVDRELRRRLHVGAPVH